MSFWQGRNVFVTGGAGFLGTALTRALVARGAQVTCLIRDWVPQAPFFFTPVLQQVTVVRGEIEDYNVLERSLNEYEIETVFHLAAQPIVGVANRNPLATFEANIKGTWNVLEAARRNPTVKRIVVASSDKAYGDHKILPYDEDFPLQGRHPYDVSKSCADLISLTYAQTYGLPVSITRCGNLFGPGDLNFSRIVPGTIRSVLAGQRPVIRSDGSPKRDYVFIEDIVGAYLLLAEQMERPEIRGRAFNFGTGEPLSVLQLTEAILQAAGRADLAPVVLNEVKGEIIHQYLKSERARNELGWSPGSSLAQRLAESIAWYRDYFGRLSAGIGELRVKTRVFVGIPTFNRPRYIRETIESVRAQTMYDWRAVVSDNASPPEAAAEVRAYVESLGDARITYVLQPENGGEFGQGRFFFQAARDEDYFVILHDDDVLQPDYLATATRLLDQRPDLAYYHCTPGVMDENSQASPALTQWYHDYHGHAGVPEGEIVILDRLLSTGFTPICGTCIRLACLRESGIVDPDLSGNYPFELNVLLRLGENGRKAWYSSERRLVFRMHGSALRMADRLMQNSAVVEPMITLLERRTFAGGNERRRRIILGRLYRARAMIDLRAGRFPAARSAIRRALHHNWLSKNTLLVAPGILLAPGLLARLLPASRNIACPPSLAQVHPAAQPVAGSLPP